MDERTSFLILLRAGVSDAIPMTGPVGYHGAARHPEEPDLNEVLEGKFGLRIQSELDTGH